MGSIIPQVRLLPDELCHAEEIHAAFGVHCAGERFHLFDWGGITTTAISCKIFLTDTRVSHHKCCLTRS
jgi:hypothetical protein